MLIIRDGRNTVNRKKKKTAAKREASAAGGCIIPVIVFRKHTDKLEFDRRAGGQVVRKICVVVSALTRSVSFFRAKIGIWRADRNGSVGDGFPVPPHTSFQIPGDGKPVPYEWMTIDSPKFDGDSHTRKADWFGMTRSDGTKNSNFTNRL